MLAVVLALGSGMLYGLQTHRWTIDTRVREAAEKLDRVPRIIGDWEGRDIEISEEQLEQAAAVGYINRRYRNSVTGEEVSVMVLCGPSGPISLHPPTVCFTGAGWKMDDLKRETVLKRETGDDNGPDNRLGRFQTARFQRTTPTGPIRMRTYWAWNADGRWQAPENSRFAFASAPYLFKIYVIAPAPARPKNTDTNTEKTRDPSKEFIRVFLPALKHAEI